VSSDKDLMQLVGDGVDMLDTMKNKRIREPEVLEKFGVGPDRVIDVQALAGDSADNVPGVPGIGVKTAAQLIGEYGDLDTLLERAGEIKQNKRRENLIEFADMARVSRELVTLDDDVPMVETIDEFELKGINVDDAVAFMDAQNFNALKSRLLTHAGMADDTGPSFSSAPVVKEVNYECVTDMAALNGWIEAINKAGTVAVDTETTSLDAITARMVGISLCVEAGHACYIPLRHVSGDGDGFALEGGPKQISVEQALAALKPMLEDPSVLKVGQNIKYDMHIFKGEGIELQSIDDTMALSYVLESGLHGHGMDEMSQLFLDIKPIPFKEVVGVGKKQLTFDQVDIDKATTYAAEDADITLRLYQLFKPRLAQEKLTTVYETLERPLIPVLADMEQAGIRVDGTQLNRLSITFAEGMEILEKDIHGLAGRPFNIASPKQLGEILFDEMELKGGKKGKTGAYSTGADVLEGFAAEGHELPAKVLEWRQLAKLKSTYTDALQKQVNPKTGRVHTSYSIAATTTGRLASSDPNLQNIPIRT
ncbi:MAG: DNA polymerase I, partial [Sphingomonadales bacterium]|nr:DNA polymerase I [Sphingomonadales bacterium]